MKKSDIVTKIASSTGSTKVEAAKFLEATLSAIADGLANEGEVLLSPYFTMRVVERAERQGYNPRTGTKITIKAGKAPRCRFGKTIKDAVKL